MKQVKSLILRITERCNLKCAYCYAAVPGCVSADMTPELAVKAAALCCPEGESLKIQFTGGEPLLNFPVMEALYAFGRSTNRRLSFSVQTNGTLLSPENCARLARMHYAVGVSLDGLNEANRLRVFPNGSPSFPTILMGIRNLGEQGLRCNLTTVVTNANAQFLGQLPDLALWLGNVSGIGLDLFRPLGRGAETDYSPGIGELRVGLPELIRKTRDLRKAGIPFRLREMERLKHRASMTGCGEIYCYAQSGQSLCVDASGSCWPCSSLAGSPEFYLGNLRDGLPRLSGLADALAPGDPCRQCPSFSVCAGGCPAGRTVRSGAPNPLTCEMNRILLEEFER